jgi:hypothetical protein
MTSAGIGKANTDIAGVSADTVPTTCPECQPNGLQGRHCFSFSLFPLLSRYVLLAFRFAMTGLEAPPTTEHYWLELP